MTVTTSPVTKVNAVRTTAIVVIQFIFVDNVTFVPRV